MAIASDYAITTGYGNVAGYQLNNGFHKGEDRPCPFGTGLVVNGMLIGLTGNSGECYDARGRRNTPESSHLHTGRWVGGQPTNPQGGGFSLPGATVYATGEDNANGKWIQLLHNGAVWCYLHLSRIDVHKGQVINAPVAAATQGDEMIANNEQAVIAYRMLRPNSMPNDAEINQTAGKRSWWQFARDGLRELDQRDANIRAIGEQLAAKQQLIDQQTGVINDFAAKLSSAEASNQEKLSALNKAMSELDDITGKLNAVNTVNQELHDKLAATPPPVKPSPAPAQPASGEWFFKLLAILTKWKTRT